MQANDRERFNDLIRTLCKPYRLELDATDFDIWWVVLNEFPFEAIEASVVQYLKTGKYAPKPADLYTVILDRYRSLWWSPDEAWVHALKAADEDETVVWTNEAATAFGEARIALERGDEFGARAAFIKAYQRLVEAAIEDRRVPEYTVSLGFDRQRRINAIQQAKAQGYLPADRANRLLAENSQGMKEDARAIVGLITGNVVEHPSANAKRLADLMRETLAKVDAEEKAQMAAKDALREQRRQAMQDRKRQIVTQAESLAETMGASDTQAVAAGNSE
ncbi:hypothetical protein [Acidithiobacillus caldus]|uniref:Replicative helicase inhibitor G39P N-terminal domain-containing protein n=1 Tax=Acidithiobacillus caldus (strain ATCC 51756 / DSM 8584 / KU) TaxID=637389 RepID=A0A060A0Y6_ACICK|nr:hypothetical protein [Acidithiobacillus caldus]AIA55787.1 hypothetical protein Acaty_c1928 [Acidithiobacillus caldus ATCC 51756]MBU2729812.1 hypothetical protein [Acidithiobacillus caldus]MBU2736396.1 hypothetical protein [Acidithiobacillus caldus ATCC 51756]MBU2743973.1 hypothetical protein [Acidithiobacillus caldus]MBU2779652.1 hypothetical protein [Acidithiobacillus caldus]